MKKSSAAPTRRRKSPKRDTSIAAGTETATTAVTVADPQNAVTWSGGSSASVQEAKVFHEVAVCRWCGGKFRQVHGFQWLCDSDQCAEIQIAHAIPKLNVESGRSPYFFLPLPLQVDMDTSPVKRLLVHGPRGISKSVGGRMYVYGRARKIAGYRGLLLRCTYDQLKKNHLQFIPGELAQFANGARWLGGNENRAILENDAQIYMGYCQNDADIAQHMGVEFDDVLFEEAVHFLPRAITDISTSDRGAGTSREARMVMGMPNTGRSRYLTNPGGRAMRVLEDFCIRREPDVKDYPHYDPRFYGHIHGDIRDNPYLAADYKTATLGGLDAARFEQLAEGRWDVFPGQFFTEWDKDKHIQVIEASDAPFVAALLYSYNAVGVFLVARLLPRGRLYVETLWKFQYQTIPEVASALSQRITALGLTSLPMVCPIEMAADDVADDGTVKAESPVTTFARHKISLRPIDANDYGWQRIHDHLRLAPDGMPWLIVSPVCDYLTRTLPTLMQDDHHADEIAKDQDDRAALALRTLVASRPLPGAVNQPKEPPEYLSFGWFKAQETPAPALGVLRR